MLNLIKTKFFKPDIVFHCTEPGITEISPIQKSSCLLPEWWKKMDYDLDVKKDENGKSISSGTIKKCPGIIEYLKNGFILPMWTDLYLEVKDRNDIKVFTSNNTPIISPIGDNQLLDHLITKNNNFIKVLKLHTPWVVEVKKHIRILYQTPFFFFNEYFETIPGIKHRSSVNLNVFIILKKTGNYSIERGTPLCVLLPYYHNSFTYKCKGMDFLKSETLKRGIQNINRSKFSSTETFKKIISKNKCPYSNFIKEIL